MAKVAPADIDPEKRPLPVKICDGSAGCLWNTICCPFVMLGQSISIYTLPCVGEYLLTLLDLLFCALLRAICCACCCQHTDEKFPPNSKSLGAFKGKTAPELDREVEWVRASDFFGARLTEEQRKRGVRLKLFEEGIDAGDVAQGQLGDCWLIAAFACMAEHPGLLRRCFLTKRRSPTGRYRVRLFDPQGKRWRTISVDENIPIWRSSRSLLFAQPQGRELWVVILEKAFAKMMGTCAGCESNTI